MLYRPGLPFLQGVGEGAGQSVPVLPIDWDPREATSEIWSGEEEGMAEYVRSALAEEGQVRGHQIACHGVGQVVREAVQLSPALGVELHVPPRELCTDNAAMIASAARYTTAIEYPGYLELDACASA